MGSMIRSTGTVFYSLLYLNSRQGFNGLKYLYSIFSVKIDSLPANTKNRESTRSWTARVRFLHPWANLSEKTYQECGKKKMSFLGPHVSEKTYQECARDDSCIQMWTKKLCRIS